jgi:hypothetical protein
MSNKTCTVLRLDFGGFFDSMKLERVTIRASEGYLAIGSTTVNVMPLPTVLCNEMRQRVCC